MKKILMFFVLLMAAANASAQDVIVKKDGNTVISKVMEVTTTEIKYKKWSNQNGPLYTILISEVLAINYENSERESFSDKVVPQQSNSYQSQEQQVQVSNTNSSWTNENFNNGYTQNTYNGHTKAELLRSAKKWHVGAEIWYWGFCITGAVSGYFLASIDGGFDTTTYLISFGGGFVTGIIGYLIFDGIGDRRERAANRLSASHIFKQDFNLGSTHLTAGLDLMNDRMTNNRTLGLGVSLNF